MRFFQLRADQRRVIVAVTWGNILEWFEIYLYAYWAPILSTVFFGFGSELLNVFGVFLIFGSGFLARPFGAILFGRIGDLLGRKKAYLLSILLMTIPTFLMGFLPTYSAIGLWAPVMMTILRLLQSMPAAGEVPGSICYLYENSETSNRRYMTSWTAVGNQIGAILGILEYFVMENYFESSFLAEWGWRISFWMGGLIGVLGVYLRSSLIETPEFKKLKSHHNIDKETITQVVANHKRNILWGIGLSAINASTFYLIATYLPIHFSELIGIQPHQSAIFYLLMLSITTVLLPYFGRLGDKYNNRRVMILCTFLMIGLLYPISYSIMQRDPTLFIISSLIYLLPLTCLTALLAYWLAHLFRTGVRFTCVGLSFNIADGIIGGFTPAISLLLYQFTGSLYSFVWYILLCAIVSLVSFYKIAK